MSKIKRRAIRGSFTRAFNELKEELDKGTEADPKILKISLRRLEDRFSQLDKVDEVIMQEMVEQDVTQEEMNDEIDVRQEYRDKMNDVTTIIEELCKPDETERPTSVSGSVACCGEGKSRYKLPKLELVKFNGEPKNWLNFWSQFKGIHEDENLSSEEKFQYLIQATVIDSPARSVVASFPSTAENYPKAIDYLKTRFGKDSILVEVYVRDLLKLVTDPKNQYSSLSTLYDTLTTKIRALESLGVTSNNYAAMLYPLVESTLSEELIKTWERTRNNIDGREDEDQLNQLMKFLQREVESEGRLKMAKRGTNFEDDDQLFPKRKHQKIIYETATDLMNSTGSTMEKCVFCGKNHRSQYCIAARKMTITEKNTKIMNGGRCFKCLQTNHQKRECKAFIKCQACGKSNHCAVMCIQNSQKEVSLNTVAFNYHPVSTILQTLLITLEGSNGSHIIRVIIDTGSHQSYITDQTVKILGLTPIRTFETAHSLFGGFVTRQIKHSIYKTTISNQHTGYHQQIYLLNQAKICGPIPPVQDGPWINELRRKNIELSDFNSGKENIDVLLGADTASTLFTGRICPTKNGPVAFETEIGWTLMGKSTDISTRVDNTLALHSLYVGNACIQDLWRMDLIGIHDSADSKSREQLSESALQHFQDNVKRTKEGRYEVALPWIEGHQPVATNRELSQQRLVSAINKLRKVNKIKEYNDIFIQWSKLGIIERIEDNDNDKPTSYLPHHPVFNFKSSTTPIRPVFDASAKSKGAPSLNDCLETGPNLLELIMILLLLFRMKQYGVIADIEKAFLQISVKEEDRNFLRFLWSENGKTIIYRHCRVVFGVSSSPFLLAATLNNHLDNAHVDFHNTAQLLKKSTYVDNCVTSVNTTMELKKFMNESTVLCKEAQFNLRGWVWNRGKTITGEVPGVGSPECGLGAGSDVFQETSNVSVLGLMWDIVNDTLSLDLRKVLDKNEEIITKRKILAATHRIFDPLGFVSPVTIVPKKILQEVFKQKLGWDKAVPEEIARRFTTWMKSIKVLQKIKIPRWVTNPEYVSKSIHVFSDACKNGYAAVAFIRTDTGSSVNVQLLISKARVSTIKTVTIPKLELVSCECGANISETLRKTIDVSNIQWYFWSDSSNALSWIKRKENWHVFVHNRVKKIRELTNVDDWRHIPGQLNPADLPSRGCTPKQLLESRWWEGPDWLKLPEQAWPKSEINCDENIVMAEKRNIVISNVVHTLTTTRFFSYFSKLRKIIRMIAWMLRWKSYKRNATEVRGDLTTEEEENAENCLWRMVQSEVFDSSDKVIKQINAAKDEYGLWRVRTKILMRPDADSFRLPILLPKRHVAVERLIQREHLQYNHCGPLVLRSMIRERFWILQGRVIIHHEVNACKRCKRYKQKHVETSAAPLPCNRVREASTFEIVGIDLGGPLYLEDEKKAWFVVFTCAVYRAVHLELVTSISSMEFIQALRRFIARRNRPAVIYTDNGTNFTGTENLLAKLNWQEIMSSSTALRIKWIFNPPSSPWWGGWWERIVGMVKQLLRRILGKSLLNFQEMVTILCDCEQTINARPITYLTENPEELIPLTPMMFLNESRSYEVPDLDMIENNTLQERYRYQQKIRQQLRERFRKEYLSMLVHRVDRKSDLTTLRVGDVVLVETENKKRVDWPIARIVEVYPGIDGIIRSVQLKVVKGNHISIMTRATKKLYLLEASLEYVDQMMKENEKENEATENENGSNHSMVQVVEKGKKSITSKESKEESAAQVETTTRSGRKTKVPDRFQC